MGFVRAVASATSARMFAAALLCLPWPASTPSATAAPPRVLRVCADPNNLPFSDRAGEGFENHIAELLARDLHAKVEYTWWAQRRGYARNTVKADHCDLWPGVAAGVESLDTTRPYYRSSYVFVSRADRDLDIGSFDDPRLRALTIGVQMIGNDATNTPPTHALARRGIIDNVRGYMVYGHYDRPDPEAPIVRALIAMAAELGLNVVGEGVETEIQLELLRRYRCPQAQGYLLGMPQPSEDVARLLAGPPIATVA